MKRLFIFMIITMSCISMAVAADEQVTGKHADNGMECADCHETDTPVKRANWKICVDCHGDMSDRKDTLTFKDKEGASYSAVIHTPHAGQIKCTNCHSSHQKSSLFCNKECHNFVISVP